jgi:uncharacterized RDD family membrane protein YckC
MAEATYGGFWIRTLAYAADLSILTLALLVLAVPFVFMGSAGMALYSLIAAIGPVAYFAWLTASKRQSTFGKQLCALKVQHAGSAERISLLRSIGRELAKFVSAAVLFIGFLLAAFTQRKQGLHDTLASTVVVRDGPPRIVLATLVALAGVVIPVIVIPLMFAGMFAGLMAMLMGGMMGEMEVKSAKPAPRMEQKAAPRPQANTAQSAPAKPVAAVAAEDPETVFSNYHKAVLANDIDEMLKWSVKSRSDAFAAATAEQRKEAMASTAKSMPKTYKVTGSLIERNGTDAALRMSAEVTDKGKTETMYGSAVLEKEGGGWKVAAAGWGHVQPPSLPSQSGAAQPAVAAPPEPPKPVAVELPKPAATPTPAARPAPSRSEAAAAKPAAPTLQQGKPPCVYKPVMTDEDIARCR